VVRGRDMDIIVFLAGIDAGLLFTLACSWLAWSLR
jgi:hypothetical protein